MRVLRGIFFCSMAFLLTSCADLTPPVPLTFTPDGNTVVLYGRFTIGPDFVLGNRLVLWLKNVSSKKSVCLYFDKQRPVNAILVDAGQYRMVGFAGTDVTHRVLGRLAFRGKSPMNLVTMPFEVRTNSAVYIGDFTGRARMVGLDQVWEIDSFTNNFAATTRDFREQYPNLVSVPAFSMVYLQSR
jgi:hypothetical protein